MLLARTAYGDASLIVSHKAHGRALRVVDENDREVGRMTIEFKDPTLMEASRGLGDTVAKVIHSFPRPKPQCGRCGRTRHWLNRLLPYRNKNDA